MDRGDDMGKVNQDGILKASHATVAKIIDDQGSDRNRCKSVTGRIKSLASVANDPIGNCSDP